MASSEEFQKAALEVFEKQTPAAPPAPQPAAITPPAPPPAQGAPAAAPPVSGTPPVAPPPTAPGEPQELKGFDELARQKAAFRKEQQEKEAKWQKHARLIEVAERGGTALELLAAGNKSYSDVTKEVLAGKLPSGASAPAPAAADNPVAKEVSELKQMLMQEREQRARAELTSQAQKLVSESPDKFKAVSAMGKAGEAVEMLNRYYTETGELPVPGNLQASLQAAIVHVEKQEMQRIETGIPILQKLGYVVTKSGAESNPPKPAVQPPASGSQGTQSKTLNNSLGAPSLAAPKAEPQTAAEYQKAALQKFEEFEVKAAS